MWLPLPTPYPAIGSWLPLPTPYPAIGAAGSSLSHADARRIVIEAWRRVHGRDPTDLEAAYTQAIAWGENQYGRFGQFGAMAARGQFNWGSLHARGRPPDCPAGSAPGTDVGKVCFLVFPDDVSAAAAFVRVLTKQHWPTIEAMAGTPEDVARAMRVPPAYYEGAPGTEQQKISAYAGLIRRSLDDVRRGAPVPAIPSAAPASRWILPALVLGGAGYLYYRSYGVPPALRRLLPA